MQTFMPYRSFARSAECLDMKRLGKQRVEAKQVLQAILDVDKFGHPGNTGQAFVNHPIMLQWAPYPEALLTYTYYICKEWRARGYKDGILPWLFQAAGLRDLRMMPYVKFVTSDAVPWWLGLPKVHVYHRANLLVKMPEHYEQFRWQVPERLRTGFGYSWPGTEPGTWRTIRRPVR